MANRVDSAKIREFILTNAVGHPADLARLTAEAFGFTRQTAHNHIKRLVEAGVLLATGTTRDRRYQLSIEHYRVVLDLGNHRDEDMVWRQYAEPRLMGLERNLATICHHGFTEMFNNVIDHSEGTEAIVTIARSPVFLEIKIADDGIGIFEKIKQYFELEDHRQAILELSKGKLTTDDRRHSGEGIYFTSRMFDRFEIFSNHLYFIHQVEQDDWLIEGRMEGRPGTTVRMTIACDSKRTTQEVYDHHISETVEEEFAFARTHVPLKLAMYSEDRLVSRSQAKRVLRRFDRFKEVLLDFAGVDAIGQGFADEIFRVFRQSHPEIRVIRVNSNPQVERMVQHVLVASGVPEP